VELLTAIAAKKQPFDELVGHDQRARAPLRYRVDYTSNAIEGNTLTPVETTLVLRKGITISSKPLKDHLEALDHDDAIRYVRHLARQTTPLLACAICIV